GLSVCEAMLLGLPVVGLATTEMAVTFKNGVSGYVHTDLDFLIDKMKLLLKDKQLAMQIGRQGMDYARQRFNINRFTQEWEQVFRKTSNRDRQKHYELEA